MPLFLADLIPEKSLKAKIVKLLSDEGPLHAKEVKSLLHSLHRLDVSYQAVHKDLKELKENGVLDLKGKEYCLSLKWLSFLHSFAEVNLARLGVKCPSAKNCVMEVFTDPDDYYKIITPLFSTEKVMRFSSKSPALIIAKESDLTRPRKSYTLALKSAIKNKQLLAKYLISEDYTRDLILKYHDLEAVKKLKRFMAMENIQIRCAPTKAIISYAVSSRDFFINPTAIRHDESIAMIYIRGNMAPVIKIFDAIFAEAKEVNDLVEELEKKLRVKK
ncbi:MAG: hypothetical protein JW744_05835 [Candidatus Diapherotrites archaeon]|uniref:Uncharacterized protein n=1 Tax=Candidatus Iainarchaeum sp. TaxID=3101447 RepID=A0A938YYE1_9ARCH|nr:hypothetical protein [Candidatus Diapherotrites archaeon]